MTTRLRRNRVCQKVVALLVLQSCVQSHGYRLALPTWRGRHLAQSPTTSAPVSAAPESAADTTPVASAPLAPPTNGSPPVASPPGVTTPPPDDSPPIAPTGGSTEVPPTVEPATPTAASPQSNSNGPSTGGNTGLTADQRSQLITASGSFAYGCDSLGATLGGIYGASNMAAARAAAIAGGSALGAGGYFLALVSVYLSSTDVVQQFLEREFDLVKTKLDTLTKQIRDIPNKVESSNALQTYIGQRNDLMAVNTAFEEYENAITDSSQLALVTQQCDLHSPYSFLQDQVTSLTADGSCDFPTQCWLAPNAGVAKQVAYSRPGFLDWAKLFLQDSILAANFAVLCPAAEGSLNSTINSVRSDVQDKAKTVALNLESYYDGVMTTAFWQDQFDTDVSTALNGGGSNSDLAKALTDLLGSKYDFLKWSAAVWDGSTGSTKQGLSNPYCNTDPPDSTCSANGGMVAVLRTTLTNPAGDSKSYAIWFSPSVEAGVSSSNAATYQTLTDTCAPKQTNHDLVGLVDCLSAGVTDGTNYERGIVCIPKGSDNLGYNLDPTVITTNAQLYSEDIPGSYADGTAICFIHPPKP